MRLFEFFLFCVVIGGLKSTGSEFFFMLISVEHEILNNHKYKNIKKFQHFSGSYRPRMLFFLLINVKMPTIVGMLTFMSRTDSMINRVEHKKYITSEPDICTWLVTAEAWV